MYNFATDMINEVYSASPARYEQGMPFRRAGRSGICLPAVSLGLWQNFGDTAPLARSRDMVRYAFDHGVTHFDLANNYGPSFGSAEETFGRIMASDMRPYRHEMFISTKAGYDMWPGPYGNLGSRKYLLTSLEESLQRMHLDYVDLFYSHRFDPDTPIEETLQALVDAVRQGKALYVGISNWPAVEAAKAYEYLAARDVHCLLYQGRINMLDRDRITGGELQGAADAGTGFIAFSPLAQGLLTNRYLNGIPADSRAAEKRTLPPSRLTPEVLEKVRALAAIAADRGQSIAQMAVAWLLADARITSVIVGASSTAQLADTLRAADNIVFTPDELEAIERIIR